MLLENVYTLGDGITILFILFIGLCGIGALLHYIFRKGK